MTPTAMHQAIRLIKHPKEMAWICQSNVALPEGITDLLRLCASNTKIKSFAEKYHTSEDELQKTLLNFVDEVLLNENNSNERLLGLKEGFDADLCKLHYQLLIKTYHPDKNSSHDASYQTARITKAYQDLKNSQQTSDEYKNIRISRVPPKSFYKATIAAEQQISDMKSAFLAMLTITIITAVWIGGYLYEPANTELFSENPVEQKIVIADQSNVATQKKASPEIKTTEQQPLNKPFTIKNSSTVANVNLEPKGFQKLLTSIEVAYEKGQASKIQAIMDSPEIKQQSDVEVFAKIEELFKITSERKMLLYNFEWENLSGKITGKGKFLSRYHLVGEDQWLTREGVASILATQENGEVDIYSLKFDNNNIDQ